MESRAAGACGGVAADGTRRSGRVSAVLAVKHLRDAKTRLAATLSPFASVTDHRSLVLAMLLDTIGALTSAGVGQILVVSPDNDVLTHARAAGVRGVREPARGDRETPVAGLNRAFADGAHRAQEIWPESDWVLLIQADLPAARATSLIEVIDAAEQVARNRLCDEVLLADRDGSGTVLLLRRPSCVDPPRFGAGSAAAHRGAGALELDPDRLRWSDLRTDVDTAGDLDAAAALGLGPKTSAVLSAWGESAD